MIGKRVARKVAGETETITWQLVRGMVIWWKPSTWTSWIIGFFGAGFYSHIDVVTPKGMLRGARSDVIRGIEPGYLDRPQNYEKWARCTRYTIEVPIDTWKRYWEYSDNKVGAPYDERALIFAFAFGFKHKVHDKRDKWVGWCSQEVAINGAHAGLWKIPSEVSNVTPGDCAFLFCGKNAVRTEMSIFKDSE